jgi:AcrR family transcriptional regulator
MAELSQRSFEEITVQQICERAMVHRSTFYKHYEDKYALLERGVRQMYDELVAHEEHLPPSAFSVEHPPPYFLRLFEHAAAHPQFYKLMLCGGEGGRFQKLVKEYLTEVLSTKEHEVILTNEHCIFPLAMQAHFIAGAVLSLLAWWLENDMPLSPRMMAKYLLSVSGTSSLDSIHRQF